MKEVDTNAVKQEARSGEKQKARFILKAECKQNQEAHRKESRVQKTKKQNNRNTK